MNGPGGYFGRNLDAFADCLSGGTGTPDDGDFSRAAALRSSTGCGDHQGARGPGHAAAELTRARAGSVQPRRVQYLVETLTPPKPWAACRLM
ncbi:barstar family protein [Streptomyces finlayi]|uniref:barstar family protein n=1 Tax=Streptomyces finlayi TaxID=67296 RepID=UPI00215655E8